MNIYGFVSGHKTLEAATEWAKSVERWSDLPMGYAGFSDDEGEPMELLSERWHDYRVFQVVMYVPPVKFLDVVDISLVAGKEYALVLWETDYGATRWYSWVIYLGFAKRLTEMRYIL